MSKVNEVKFQVEKLKNPQGYSEKVQLLKHQKVVHWSVWVRER